MSENALSEISALGEIKRHRNKKENGRPSKFNKKHTCT